MYRDILVCRESGAEWVGSELSPDKMRIYREHLLGIDKIGKWLAMEKLSKHMYVDRDDIAKMMPRRKQVEL